MHHHHSLLTPATQWRAAYSAARAGRIFLDQPMAHEALSVVADAKGSNAHRRSRWLAQSIPDLAATSRSRLSPVDIARWLVSARAFLYLSWAARRSPVVFGGLS